LVAPVGPERAGFLVAPKRKRAKPRPNIGEYANNIPTPNNQLLAKPGKIRRQR
jgi:hypothetical protein